MKEQNDYKQAKGYVKYPFLPPVTDVCEGFGPYAYYRERLFVQQIVLTFYF